MEEHGCSYGEYPPCFSDFVQFSNKLFESGYFAGMLRAEVNTKTGNGISYSLLGNHDITKGITYASLMTKYDVPEQECTIMSEWKTDSSLFTKLYLRNNPIAGIFFAPKLNFHPYTGKKSGCFSVGYSMNYLTLTADVLKDDDQFQLIGGIVGKLKCSFSCCPQGLVTHHNFLGGYQLALDFYKRRVSRSQFAIGYNTSDFFLSTYVENASIFGTSLNYKISPVLETGFLINYNAYTNKSVCTLGWRYQMDDTTEVRAKVNNDKQLSLSYSQQVNPGVKVTISTNLEFGATHDNVKMGLGFQFNL